MVADPVYIADMEAARLVLLEGLTLVFHPRSGMTHILAPPSPEILTALEEGPAGRDILIERLAARFDLGGEDPAALVGARLAELEAAGLVRRA